MIEIAGGIVLTGMFVVVLSVQLLAWLAWFDGRSRRA